jgi:hypothetical protein
LKISSEVIAFAVVVAVELEPFVPVDEVVELVVVVLDVELGDKFDSVPQAETKSMTLATKTAIDMTDFFIGLYF